jgi:hypothetical protein
MSNDLVIPTLDSDDISASTEDAQKVNTSKMDWYKAAKERTDIIAIVNFASKDLAWLRAALAKNPNINEEQKRSVLLAGRKQLAEKLNKSVDELDTVDLLDLTECRFKAVSGSYKEGVGYVAWPRTLTAEESKVYTESKVGPRKDYVTTIIAQYPLDSEGEMVDPKHFRSSKDGSLRIKVLPWRMSTDKYHDLVRINKKLAKARRSLADTDLTIECTDTGFQKLKMDERASEESGWRKDPEVRRMVLERALRLQDKLEPFKKYDLDLLREKLNMSAPAASGAGSEDTDTAFIENLETV